ncbi:MAG TPA: hypothetical protein VN228_03600 [Pyrinomonadaceae bacterium]|nr:hypothetical protein [Pyrinomonadaceae bacterium]
MKHFKTTRLAATCAGLLLLAAAAAEAKAWRRVVPLRTTRAQVERRFGKPRPRDRRYHFRAESALVNYAGGGGCAGGAEWDVPRDTVLSIFVTPKRRLDIGSLRLDMTKFKKTTASDTPSRALYTNEEEGITYDVFDAPGEYQGRVQSITYGPTAEDQHRRCPDRRQPPAR